MRAFTLPGAAALSMLAAAGPALAHHPLGGLPMTTFAQGALSGVGHPLLGFDHLFFVLAMGVAAAFTGARATAPLAYVAAMAAGLALCVLDVALPFVEGAVALSLLAVGAVLMRGRALPARTAMALFAAAGLFHGWAFGGSLAGQEGGASGTVFAGYLLGLALTQYALAMAAGHAATALMRARHPGHPRVRMAGAMAAGVGAFLTLETLEGPALALLSLT
jgi:urease accessory protein